MAGRASSRARPPGRHALRSRAFADEIVRDAGVARDSVVLDLGAGSGVLAGALVGAGARVLAVELDAAALRQLRKRFAHEPGVDVIEGDATAVALPDGPFTVVANLPFGAGTAILRRLLGDPRLPLTQLDAIVEWGLAAKRAAVWPSTLLGCTWGAWYELRLVRRVPRACFAPRPSVDAALFRATRRAEALVPLTEAREYTALLQRAFGSQAPLDRVLPRGIVHRVAHDLGFDPRARARDLDPSQWAQLYAAVRAPRPATSRPQGSRSRRRPSTRR